MHELLQDIRYSWRALLRAPGFSLTVGATLAIGIGATVAIFAVVNAMLLRPLPYPDSDRMVMVWQDLTRRGGPDREWFTPPDFVDLRDQTSSFTALAAVGDEMFMTTAQVGSRSAILVARTRLGAATAGAAIRDAVRSIDPALPPPAFRDMEQIVAQTIALPRLYSAFFTFFAAVSLLLAAVGVYGLTAYTVGQRRQEIGIRVALGARSGDVVRMVVRRSFGLTLIGLAMGIIAAFALARPLAVLLFDLSAHDIATFTIVPAILGIVALVASWLPARRAAHVDPLTALRAE